MEQTTLPGVPPLPSSEKIERVLAGVRFGAVGTASFLTFILSVKQHNTDQNVRVDILMLYDPDSDKLIKLRQGKGSTWKDIGIGRKKAQRIQLVAKQRCRKYLEQREYAHHVPELRF